MDRVNSRPSLPRVLCVRDVDRDVQNIDEKYRRPISTANSVQFRLVLVIFRPSYKEKEGRKVLRRSERDYPFKPGKGESVCGIIMGCGKVLE